MICFFDLTVSFRDRYSNPAQWTVYSGDVSLAKMRYGGGKKVRKIITHEGFDTKKNDNDIALLKLNTPLTFTSERFSQ